MEKLKIHCTKPLSRKETNIVRVAVRDDTLAELKNLSAETGLAMSHLARLLIEYALPKTEVIE